jgi:hypothetical protein
MRGTCFECDAPAECAHHVVPRQLGGTRTIPLCAKCHGLVHGIDAVSARRLTSLAAQRKMERGEFTGGLVPYGFRLTEGGVILEIVPAEATTIRLAKVLRRKGMSLGQIAADLFARGLRSRAGKRFGAKQIARMLQSRL